MIRYVCGPFRKEIMLLTQRTEIAGDIVYVPFEKEIIWNRVSESTIEFRHGGKLLKTGSCFNDYYGHMTSVQAAIEEAKAQARIFEIGPESSLTILVRTIVKEVPMYRTQRCRISDLNDDRTRHELEDVEATWLVGRSKKILESVELSSEVTWDSGL